MFKVEDVQMVRAMGSGVAGGNYGFADLDRGEEKEGVNCLQKALAMEVVLERLPLPNMIGWLGATAVFFPESEQSRE